jgi:lambda family phage portal protein
MAKEKIATRFYRWWTGEQPQPARRSYAAARLTKGNANWTTQPTGANYETRVSLQSLRARARQLARDNGHIKHFLSLTRSNIVGKKGIRLQSRALMPDGKTLNVDLNRQVEAAWKEWGYAENCTVSGKMNWRQVQDLAITRMAVDGEFLIQMVEADNGFGFALKHWDVNWLLETYNEVLPNGNRVIMSVEVNSLDQPVAYWLTTPSSEINFTQRRAMSKTRVPAEEMIHGFLVLDDETQVRGITWFHAAALDAKNFLGYTEGVIQSARMAANIPFFIEETVPAGEEYLGPESTDGTSNHPDIDVTNLGVTFLNPGQKMQQFDPKQPTQNHPAFVKTILMGLAAALGVPYFVLAGDWEAVNYSSSRGGLNEAREVWQGLQDHLAATLCRRVFRTWVRRALLAGKIKMSMKDFEAIQNPKWIPRGWPYIDPTKDVAADVMRLQNRLATPSEILAEQGVDYPELLDRWEADAKLAAAKGIDINAIYTAPKTVAPGTPADDPNADDTPPADDKQPKRELTNGHLDVFS